MRVATQFTIRVIMRALTFCCLQSYLVQQSACAFSPISKLSYSGILTGREISTGHWFDAHSKHSLTPVQVRPYKSYPMDQTRQSLAVSLTSKPLMSSKPTDESTVKPFDPFSFGDVKSIDSLPADGHKTIRLDVQGTARRTQGDSSKSWNGRNRQVAVASLVIIPAFAVLGPVEASGVPLSTGDFNPDNFKPVCGASDSFYRLLQGTTQAIVGDENFVEYGPLIAGGLLRVRLELCVVESFFQEAVGPFIEKNGVSWILPLHETVETFLAGTIFAVATTFILVGSTKLVSVIVTYGDFFVGRPLRLFGGFAFDRARGKPVTLDVGIGPWKKRLIGTGGPKEDGDDEGDGKLIDFDKVPPAAWPVVIASGAVKSVGEVSKITREFMDALDLFVGRYLVIIATGYIGLKFLHFKVFPDFPA